MNTITLYRRDFRPHADDGESMFNDVLRDLGLDKVPGTTIEDIEEIELTVDSFVASGG